MKLTIHKGTREIGGTCIEVSSEKTVLLDIGQPLQEESQPIDTSKINFDAVVLTHPHQDHYGLIETIDGSIPVHTGAMSRNFIDAVRMFIEKSPLRNNFHKFSAWQPFTIGDIKIMPYLVDHSAADAYAFLLEANGKRLFYTGDFRAHGNKKILFEKMVANPPKDVDVLLMEGTMLRRDNAAFPTEESVREAIQTTIADQENISFLISSSQNIDRVVSAYKACLKTGKTLVIDLYTAWILELVQKATRNVPVLGWPQLKIFVFYRHNEILKKHPATFGTFKNKVYRHRVTKEELREKSSEYFMLAKASHVRFIKSFKESGPVNVLYSQWRGYLEPERIKSSNDRQFAALLGDPAFRFTFPHTSGHATVDDLKVFAEALNPKMIVPVHTEYADEYKDHFHNVHMLADGEMLNLH